MAFVLEAGSPPYRPPSNREMARWETLWPAPCRLLWSTSHPFQLQTKVNSQHGQHSQPLQQVDSASNVRDLPTFSISLRPGQCFFMHGTSSSAFLFRMLWISTPIQSTLAKTNIEPENAPLKKENVYIFLLETSLFSFQPLTPQS